MKMLILSSSPREDGNSATLARAAARGLRDAGHEVVMLTAAEVVTTFLKDCRTCRKEDGTCSIDDPFEKVFLDEYLPSGGFIAATPIYWYSMSAQLKAFFDRMFCYVAASYPQSSSVVGQMLHKRVGLILSSEETFPTVSAGVVHQIQEFSRYTRSAFVGTVHGHGNSRGDVLRDPENPLEQAYRFGRDFHDQLATDYQIDTPRSGRMWPMPTVE